MASEGNTASRYKFSANDNSNKHKHAHTKAGTYVYTCILYTPLAQKNDDISKQIINKNVAIHH